MLLPRGQPPGRYPSQVNILSFHSLLKSFNGFQSPTAANEAVSLPPHFLSSRCSSQKTLFLFRHHARGLNHATGSLHLLAPAQNAPLVPLQIQRFLLLTQVFVKVLSEGASPYPQSFYYVTPFFSLQYLSKSQPLICLFSASFVGAGTLSV